MHFLKRKHNQPHPEGSVLAFALVVMLLMSLAGMAILMNTRNELTIASGSAVGRNAFSSADAASQIAGVMGRILLYPDLGEPTSILTPGNDDPKFPLTVHINDENKFSLISFRNEGVSPDSTYVDRYITAGSWTDRSSPAGKNFVPHMTFTVPGIGPTGNVIEIPMAAAAFSLQIDSPDQTPGSSLGHGDEYDDSGSGVKLQALMTVTVNGRAILKNNPNVPLDKFSFDGDANEGPYSIITTIFREIL